jgi:hypothetical protein
MASSFVLAAALLVAARAGVVIPAYVSLLGTIALTTTVWVATTYLTRPTDPTVLRSFYLKARPAGPGWASIRADCRNAESPDHPAAAFTGWIAGVALVYGALFGAGHLLFGHVVAGTTASLIAVAGAVVLAVVLPRLWGSD